MSSKASQQTQQTPWRSAASKPSSQSPTIEQQQQQQQQNGPRNGLKQDAKDKSGPDKPEISGPDRSAPAALTPSSKASTRPLMNETASQMNVSPFDAANNMMPSFARKQQPSPYQPPSMQQQQQKQTQDPNSGDRNGAKTATPTQNKNDKVINEKRKSSSSPTNISGQKTDKEQRTDGEEMGKSKRTPVPSPATTPSSTPTPPEINEKEQTKDVDAENSVVSSSTSPQPVIKHPLKNKWAMW